MEYRVEELAAATGLAVDTVRFYQGKGLISAPRREGRAAIYDESHLEALERVRDLKAQGFSLSQIHRLLSDEGPKEAIGSRGLLAALLKERVGSRTLTRNDFATESGLGAPLVRAAEQAGLLVPLRIGDEERFTEADLEMARAGRAVLEAGFPLDRLIQLAQGHDTAIRNVVENAIDLFDQTIRKPEADGETTVPDATVEATYRELFPAVTRLVALHFQHALVERALDRLRDSGEYSDLGAALVATQSARLEVSWR